MQVNYTLVRYNWLE